MSLPANYPLEYGNAVGTIIALDPAQTQTVSPAYSRATGLSQVTTSSNLFVTGSTLTSSFNRVVSYYLSATIHNIKAQIAGSVDGVNYTLLGSPTTINSGNSALVTITNGGYPFYRLQIQDAQGGSHGRVTGAGFCI